MKARHLIAVGLAAVVLLGAAGCGDDKKDSATPGNDFSKIAGGDPNASGELRVWLQEDAQTGWEDLVKSTTAAFNAKYPKVTVKVDYQKWTDHLTKLDAALGGSTPPDLVEMGNTEMTSYMANGAFADITAHKGIFENSGTWSQGLLESCQYDGKLYGLPYYGGVRVVTYRKDMFQQAGITELPKTEAELIAAGEKLQAKFGSNPNFSALYMPSRFWYAALTYVNDAGGKVAVKNGSKWDAQLDSPQAIEGLKRWKTLVDKFYKGDKTIDEATPQQFTVFAKGQTAMMYGLGWENGSVTAPVDKGGDPTLKDKIGTFPLPNTKGEPMASFIGGSDLAITQKSDKKAWAAAWAKELTSNKGSQGLIKAGNIPNTTSLLSEVAADPAKKAFADAAKQTWFVPTAKQWPTVEKSEILQLGLVDIITGKVSVEEGAKAISTKIEDALNKG